MAVHQFFEDVLGDGARSTKFEAIMSLHTHPDSQNLERSTAMLIKATQFPAKSNKKIEFMYKGRPVPIRGQVSYPSEWRCTFYMTEDHALKRAFEDWIEALDETVHYNENIGTNASAMLERNSTSRYTVDIKLRQLSFNEDNETSVYVLHNCFPTDVSTVDVSYDAVGEILTFDVTFAFSHFSEDVGDIVEGTYSANTDYGLKNIERSKSTSDLFNYPMLSSVSATNKSIPYGLSNIKGRASSLTEYGLFNSNKITKSTSKAFSETGLISSAFQSPSNAKAGVQNAKFINTNILQQGISKVKNAVSPISKATSDFTKSAQLISGEVRSELNALVQPFGQALGVARTYMNTAKQIKDMPNTLKNTVNSAKSQVNSLVRQAKNILK